MKSFNDVSELSLINKDEAHRLNQKNETVTSENHICHVLYVDHDPYACDALKSALEEHHSKQHSYRVTTCGSSYQAFKWLRVGNMPNAIIAEYNLLDMDRLQFLHLLRANSRLKNVPFFFITESELPKQERIALLKEGVDDYFLKPIPFKSLAYRLNYLLQIKKFEQRDAEDEIKCCNSAIKRAFDVLASSVALILLAPLFLIVGLIIKLESKGSVFYKSKRVGMGYQIFDLYKFRSMASDADKKIDQLKHLNLYQQPEGSETESESETERQVSEEMLKTKDVFIGDGTVYTESEFETMRKSKNASIFMKFKDDPRVTNFGRFIRNTSIDELPQLINVLIGDISIVGNRPLPLYEAEKLTTDAWTERFMAPAGITGLWQVTKRGKSDMSEAERIALDNHYAQNCSFWYDIKIILKTFPALLQSENV